MSAHTPGPWIEVMLGGGKGGPNGYAIRIPGDPEATGSIGRVTGRHDGSARANAHLIAAAPELLEALVDLLLVGGMDSAGEYARAVKKARAAIAKAERGARR
jgi:hypothetical protein